MKQRAMSLRAGWACALGAGVVAVVAAGGCSSTVRERHYFASRDAKSGEAINFYKVQVEGGSELSSTRYLSGYFDPDAVDAYFNEFSQPAGGKLFPDQKGEGEGTGEARTISKEAVTPIDPEKKDRKLVMILSSNSDAVAQGIGDIAQSTDLAYSMAAIAGSDRLRGLQTARTKFQRQTNDGKRVAAAGEKLLGEVSAAEDAEAVRRRLLTFAAEVAAALGEPRSFKTVAELDQWMREHERMINRQEEGQ